MSLVLILRRSVCRHSIYSTVVSIFELTLYLLRKPKPDFLEIFTGKKVQSYHPAESQKILPSKNIQTKRNYSAYAQEKRLTETLATQANFF